MDLNRMNLKIDIDIALRMRGFYTEKAECASCNSSLISYLQLVISQFLKLFPSASQI